MMEWLERVRTLHFRRREIAQIKNEIDRLQDLLDNTTEAALLREAREDLAFTKREESLARDSISEAALAEWVARASVSTASKTIAPGIKIRVVSKHSFSETDVLAWAKEHAPVFLKLDVKRFQSEGGLALAEDLVTTELIPSVTIATDLSKEWEELRDEA